MHERDEKQICSWRSVRVDHVVDDDLMPPCGREDGCALAKGVREGSRKVAARIRVVVNRRRSLAKDDPQATMHRHFFCDGIIVEGEQCRGFILYNTGKEDLIIAQPFNVAQVTVLNRSWRQSRASRWRVLDLAYYFKHHLALAPEVAGGQSLRSCIGSGVGLTKSLVEMLCAFLRELNAASMKIA